MNKTIDNYHADLPLDRQKICKELALIINDNLSFTESKIWHSHPVWFIDGNPIVGYSSLKDGIRLMFWSGADFNEDNLQPGTGKFKDASVVYTDAGQINAVDIKRWLKKSEQIQWDYKNLIKRQGELKRLK